jgi:hypothetical protein
MTESVESWSSADRAFLPLSSEELEVGVAAQDWNQIAAAHPPYPSPHGESINGGVYQAA